MAIEINYDKIYQSNSCGPFIIIENMGRDNHSRLFVKIKFLDTGTENIVRYDIAMAGKVLDEMYGINFDAIYYSKYYGPYKIIRYIGRNNESKKIVRIKFINTGYEYNVQLRCAKSGCVKDKSINPVNMNEYDIDLLLYDDYIIDILKYRWRSMMDRCYKVNNTRYKEYGASGVTVCDMWHTLDNFLSDIYLVDNFNSFYNNPQKYQLDKDYKQLSSPKSNRIYSVSTCIFLSIYDNANLAILEKHNPENLYGIKNINGYFQVEFSVDGSKINFGVYSNIIAAANAYNYYQKYSKAEIIKLLNTNIEYMPFNETQKYLISNKQS